MERIVLEGRTGGRGDEMPSGSSSVSTLGVWTFVSVTNACKVREALIDGTLDAAVLDARAVASKDCLRLAAHKAATAKERGGMVTKALHSELVFCLGPTKHISEAFRRFGPSEKSEALLVCKFDPVDGDFEKIASLVNGESVGFDSRPAVDAVAIKKWYKVHDNELALDSLEEAVLSRIAIRDVA
jgi:EKC/KEOPS complex subunit CGI121/TPRKB